MRISGGVARGIRLLVPRGDAVRPATDSLRQAVFSSLGARLAGARFWDLFAGSGAYGLEALSRGAAGGIFVERHPAAAACVKQNLAAVSRNLAGGAVDARVITADALTWLPAADTAPTDLVFIDPPYELVADAASALFARLADLPTVKPDVVVIFEMPGEVRLDPEGWACLRRLGRGARQPTAGFFQKR